MADGDTNLTNLVLSGPLTQASTSTTYIGDGAAATPGLAFTLDTNCGIYRGGTDIWSLAAGGTQVMQLRSASVRPLVQVLADDGLVGAPEYSFYNNGTTGMYRVGTNHIGFACGGVLAASINGNTGIVTLGAASQTTAKHVINGEVAATAGAIATYLVVTVNGTDRKIALYATA
jgi:hypothetical protein